MTKKDVSILLLGKGHHGYTDCAIEFLRERVTKLEAYTGNRHQALPLSDGNKSWDWIISYLSPWVVPPWLLAKAHKAAINFHPGPPEYPGIGCTNFAIYHQESSFGVTCHHMAPQVDTGDIISIRRFALLEKDSVHALTLRCYEHIFELFKEVMESVLAGNALACSTEQWGRVPFTRKQLDELCVVRPDMPAEEISRRVRATTYPGMPGAYVILGDEKFVAVKSIQLSKDGV